MSEGRPLRVWRSPTAWWITTSILYVGACGVGERDQPETIVRDSAGVRIIENRGPLREDAEAWRLSDSPAVTIGVVEGDPVQELYDVRDAKRLSDGPIAVADAGSNEVRIYDVRGRFLRAIGAEGGGPGEFRALASIEVTAGDTILAWDRRDRRISIFDPEGDLAGTVSIQAAGSGSLWPVSRVSDGTYVFGQGSSTAQIAPSERIPGRRYRKSLPLLRFGTDGASLGTVGVFPGDEMYVSDADGRIRVGWLPFGRRLVYTGHGDGLYVGTQETYEIRLYTADGRLEQIVRVPDVDQRVRERDVEALEKSLLARARDAPEARRTVEEQLATFPFPDRKPAYDQILADALGNLWVADFSPELSAERTAWTIFDAEGRMLGRVTVPERFRIFDVGAGYVVGRFRDELDVEQVRMYELVKPPA